MEERPLECCQCKKKANIVYKEIVGQQMTTYTMCIDCPILKRKIDGPGEYSLTSEKEALCCSQCKTTLESVLLGYPVGCKECYSVFQDILCDQLNALNKIAPKLKPSLKTKGFTLHVGKTPEIDQTNQNTNRLSALNEALREALKGENYEQAAWVRDQINSLMEKSNENG